MRRDELRRTVRATAPMRLDLAGGWTDVAPFATIEGGVVVNATIALHAEARVECNTPHFRIECDAPPAATELLDGVWDDADGIPFAFHKAALRRVQMAPCTVRTRSDVPAGSGLGGSGALGVALVAALGAASDVVREPAAIAEEAFQFEAVDAELPGGRQDQYAAAFGGFNRFAFRGDAVSVRPLLIEAAFLQALQDQMVICHTGASRVSALTIARVMDAYQAGNPAVVGALRTMISLADAMVEALESSDLPVVARILSENWIAQQALDSQMQTTAMAALEQQMQSLGALGGKGAGAGAGGSMFFVMKSREAAAMARRTIGHGILPCLWALEGVRVVDA